jgi:hypothetical protein
VAAKVENLHVLLPVQLVPGGDPEAVIEVIDRDVILARKGVETEVITPCLDPQECPAPPAVPAFASAVCMNPSVDGCNYKAVIYLEFLGLTIERGYVAVQAAVNGRRFIFVNTHLETREPVSFFQAAQASELTSVLAWLSGKYALPIILAGDFNSSPNDPIVVPNSPGAPPPSDEPGAKWPEVHNPYVQLAAAGLSDAWLFRPGNVPGLSCCQEADLSNHNSQVSERIDLIWSSEVPWKVKDARVVGETVNFKTKPPGRGLWPSDHGAVVATLQFR